MRGIQARHHITQGDADYSILNQFRAEGKKRKTLNHARHQCYHAVMAFAKAGFSFL
jgi:hypothetical protein